jgi:hypothetical protein
VSAALYAVPCCAFGNVFVVTVSGETLPPLDPPPPEQLESSKIQKRTNGAR